MKLSTLILENFKAFGERQTIPLAPITVVVGANSAGKSSILQSLLLLKQTLLQSESPETLLLPRGELVNLGGFRELVFRHELTRTFEIAPLFQLKSLKYDESALDTIFRPFGIREFPDAVGVGLRFGLDRSDRAIRMVGMPCYWDRTDLPAFRLAVTDASLAES